MRTAIRCVPPFFQNFSNIGWKSIRDEFHPIVLSLQLFHAYSTRSSFWPWWGRCRRCPGLLLQRSEGPGPRVHPPPEPCFWTSPGAFRKQHPGSQSHRPDPSLPPEARPHLCDQWVLHVDAGEVHPSGANPGQRRWLGRRGRCWAPGAKPPAEIHFFTTEWDPAELTWAQFRGEVLGATDPATAGPQKAHSSGQMRAAPAPRVHFGGGSDFVSDSNSKGSRNFPALWVVIGTWGCQLYRLLCQSNL